MTHIKHLIAFFVFIGCAIGLFYHSPTRSSSPLANDEILVATYNVENLFDLVKSGQEYDIYEPFTHNWNEQTQKIKLSHTAQVICDLNASIIALEEVESPLALQQLLSTLREKGVIYPFYAISSGKANVKQALLSSFPILSSRTLLPPHPSLHERGVLHVRVEIKGKPLSFFVNHWRSKKGTEEERIATAAMLQETLKSCDEEYILLGDFNSNYNEHETSTSPITAINHTLATIDDKGRFITKGDLAQAKVGHTNLWLERPISERYSTKFGGKNGSIDAIILPSSLFDGKNIDYVDGSFGVFKPPYLLHNGNPQRWKITKQGKGDHVGVGYSDHLPVFARLSFSPYTPKKHEVHAQQKLTLKEVQHLPDGEVQARLSGVIVTYKQGERVIIKDHSTGRLEIKDPLNLLFEGEKCDLLVANLSTINANRFGWKITLLAPQSKEENYRSLWKTNPTIPLSSPLLQGEVLTQTYARYSQGRLEIGGEKIHVTFLDKTLKPKNKSTLLLHRALVRTHDRPEILLATQKDFTLVP